MCGEARRNASTQASHGIEAAISVRITITLWSVGVLLAPMRIFANSTLLVLTGLAVIACSAATPEKKTQRDDVPTDADLDVCAEMCRKQRQCAGLPIADDTTVACAKGCFRNLADRPYLLKRLRGMPACLKKQCGPAYDQCAEAIQVADEPKATKVDVVPAARLSAEHCGAVCAKTFQCLGSGAMNKEASDACVLGCTHAGGDDLRRYANIYACRAKPCGEALQACIANPPEPTP